MAIFKSGKPSHGIVTKYFLIFYRVQCRNAFTCKICLFLECMLLLLMAHGNGPKNELSTKTHPRNFQLRKNAQKYRCYKTNTNKSSTCSVFLLPKVCVCLFFSTTPLPSKILTQHANKAAAFCVEKLRLTQLFCPTQKIGLPVLRINAN